MNRYSTKNLQLDRGSLTPSDSFLRFLSGISETIMLPI